MDPSGFNVIKEYTLNLSRDPNKFKVYSLIKGYWSLWGLQDHEGLGF